VIERGLYAYWQAGKERRRYNLAMDAENLHTGVVGNSLRNLLYARCVAILGHAVALLYLLSRGADQAPGGGHLATLGALTLLTMLSFARLTTNWPVRFYECALQLLVDLLALTLLLYFSGGAYNPMSIYYLVLIGFGAIVLPRLYARALALACVTCLAGLVFLHIPLPAFSPADAGALTPAVLVGWCALLLCAGMLGWFAVDMAAGLRKSLRQEGVFGNGAAQTESIAILSSLAAGTAAELNTPLATMSAVVEDLEDLSRQDQYSDDFQLLREQLERCRAILEKLSRTARLTDESERRPVELAGFVESTVNQWLRSRPDVTAEVIITGHGDSPHLEADFALSQAFEHILNNAADGEPMDIRVDIDWNDKRCTIAFEDNGPGFPRDMLGISNRPVVRSGRSRMGVGLVICRATVARYNGYVELRNRREGGARVVVHLPRQDA
jgi:two-component system sensor histidine kinase RegB